MASVSAEQIFKKNPNFVARKIADELVLVPIQRQLENINSIYCMNEMGRAIWELMDGRRSLSEIRRELLERYEVPESTLDQDLHTLLEQLLQIKAILE